MIVEIHTEKNSIFEAVSRVWQQRENSFRYRMENIIPFIDFLENKCVYIRFPTVLINYTLSTFTSDLVKIKMTWNIFWKNVIGISRLYESHYKFYENFGSIIENVSFQFYGGCGKKTA